MLRLGMALLAVLVIVAVLAPAVRGGRGAPLALPELLSVSPEESPTQPGLHIRSYGRTPTTYRPVLFRGVDLTTRLSLLGSQINTTSASQHLLATNMSASITRLQELKADATALIESLGTVRVAGLVTLCNALSLLVPAPASSSSSSTTPGPFYHLLGSLDLAAVAGSAAACDMESAPQQVASRLARVVRVDSHLTIGKGALPLLAAAASPRLALQRLRRVGGDLTLTDINTGEATTNIALEASLFPALVAVEGTLRITDNRDVVSVAANAFPKLVSAFALDVSGNTRLFAIGMPSISAFPVLETLEASLTLSENQLATFLSLPRLAGHAALVVTINACTELGTLHLPALASLAQITLRNVASLANLDLSSLERVGAGGLEIHQASRLSSLGSLSRLRSVLGTVKLTFLPALSSLAGFESLSSVAAAPAPGSIPDGLRLASLDNLQSIQALAGLTSLGRGLSLSILRNLTSSAGLEGIGQQQRKIHGSLTISNTGLTELHALRSLTEVEGMVNVASNADLASADWLASLETVGEFIILEANNALTDVELGNLTTVGLYIVVNNMVSMRSFAAPKVTQMPSGHLHMQNNPELVSVDMHSLTKCSFLRLWNAPKLRSGNFTSLGPSLNSIEFVDTGLESFADMHIGCPPAKKLRVTALTITDNAALRSLAGFACGGPFLADQVTLTNNGALVDLDDFFDRLDTESWPSLPGQTAVICNNNNLSDAALTDVIELTASVSSGKKICSGDRCCDTPPCVCPAQRKP